MKKRWIPVFILASLGLIQAQPKAPEHWVATWATAQNLVRPIPQPRPATPPNGAPAPAPAAGASGPAITPQMINTRGFTNQTVRMMLRTSLPGKRVRIRLTNAFGSTPVTLGTAHIALRGKDSAIVPGSDRAITFDGKPGAMIGAGWMLASDPVELDIPAVAEVAVSLFFPGETGSPTSHGTALHNTYISKEGDVTAAAEIADPVVTQSYYFLAGVDVVADNDAGTIVTFGDSITDGARSSNESDHAWPALLAARLAANKATAKIGVANMGIGGNRVLRDGAGASALARWDRDVLSQPGVKWVTLMEGINDIGREASVPAETPAPDELIAAYKQLIAMSHARGIKIIGCTLTPYEGAGYAREKGEATRTAVNNWIKTSGAFDAVIDFEAATRDPQSPKKFRADFDPGDHLHPNDAGYEAMANAIDLKIFKK